MADCDGDLPTASGTNTVIGTLPFSRCAADPLQSQALFQTEKEVDIASNWRIAKSYTSTAGVTAMKVVPTHC